jgi:hypothetical protein
MNKYTLIIISVLSIIGHSVFGQSTDYSKFKISLAKIKSLTEWIISYDTSHIAVDSNQLFELFYNEKGYLMEKRWSFNTKGDLYISKKFTYNKHNLVSDIKYNNPYGIEDGFYSGSPLTQFTTFNSLGKPINTISTYKGGLIIQWNFTYLGKLLIEKQTYENDQLKSINKITYTYFDN